MEAADVANNKALFTGEWIRSKETNFSAFLRFNGVGYLLSFPLAKRGCSVKFEVSADLSTITTECKGVPCQPRTTFNLSGEREPIDAQGRICMDEFHFEVVNESSGKVALITTREDYNRSDGQKIDAVITRSLVDGDPNSMTIKFSASKKIDGSKEECDFLFVRNTGASVF